MDPPTCAAYYIVGAGGLGREVLDALLASGGVASGFLDEHRAGETVRGLPVIAPSDARSDALFTVGIADPHARLRLSGELVSAGLRPRTIIDPRAIIGPETALGPGCVVLGGAFISSDVHLAEHAQVHYNATVGHDARLEAGVTVYPGGNIGGAVALDLGTSVGANASVLQGRRIGAWAFVGSGAVVTRDVEPGSVVVGVPARRR